MVVTNQARMYPFARERVAVGVHTPFMPDSSLSFFKLPPMLCTT